MVPIISLAFSAATAHWTKDFRHLSTWSWDFLPASLVFCIVNHKWWFRYFFLGCISLGLSRLELNCQSFVQFYEICYQFLASKKAFLLSRSGNHMYKVGYSSACFFSMSWTKALNRIASRTNSYLLLSWKASSLQKPPLLNLAFLLSTCLLSPC